MGKNGMPRSTSAAARLVGVLAAGLLLAGCSALAGGVDGGSGRPAEPPAAAGSAAGTDRDPTPRPEGPLPIIGSQDVQYEGVPVRLDLNEVRINGTVMQVTFTAHNESEEGWYPFANFSDGILQTGKTYDDYWTVDGVYLIEPVNRKRYLVARVDTGACACSSNLGDKLPADASVVLTGLYAAPPADVTAVDVYIPGAAPFSAAPIAR